VQAFAIGTFMLIESQIKTVTQHNIYFACLMAFATFAWWFFHFTFTLVEAAPKDIEKVQQEPEEKAAEVAVAEPAEDKSAAVEVASNAN
jgi:hypothetical protein